MPSSVLVHGTCIAHRGRAVLLRGAPGAGKSDLALRCLHCSLPQEAGRHSFLLVADDQLIISRSEDGRLIGRSPESLAGRIEIRGVGIVQVAHVAAELCLIIDLVSPDAVPRLPSLPPPAFDYLGIKIPLVLLSPFEPSAPLKIWHWLKLLDCAAH